MTHKPEIKEGEFLCDRCNGAGKVFDISLNSDSFRSSCPKCHGAGKLDWIENIVGKQNPFITAKWGMSEDFSDDPLINEWAEKNAKQLAKHIDNEVLETMINSAKKTESLEKWAKLCNIYKKDKGDDL